MPSTYVPTPTRLVDFPRPNDGERRNAASVNQSTGPLGDGIAYLNGAVDDIVEQLPIHALNFITHPDQSSIGEMHAAAYDPKYRRWYVVGSGENVRTSDDEGHNWNASEITSVGAGEDCIGLDIDTNGNVVVATDSAYVFEKTASTGVWTKVDLGFISSSGSMLVVHDPINAKWVVFSKNAGSPEVNYSPNRTSWSVGATPASFSTVNHHDMGVNKTTGRVVLIANASGSVRVRTSDDAGTSWTSRAGFTPSIAVDYLALVRDTSVAERWLIIVHRDTGSWNTEVWESLDDGETFTRICQNVFHALYRCANLGSLLVGITENPTLNRFEIVYSTDGGAHWKPYGFRLGGSMRGIYPGAGGIVAVTSSDIFMGLRTETPAFAAFT